MHNELLHDESIVFATKIFYPESDQAPVIAHFELPDTKIKWPTEAENGGGYECIKSGKGGCR